MPNALTALALIMLAASAFAAPPPGHPSTEEAARMLRLPGDVPAAQLSHKGRVLSTTDANQYTYIEVSEDEQTRWLAAPKMVLKPGSVIHWGDGAVMHNFHSRLLDRTFPVIMFVNDVMLTTDR